MAIYSLIALEIARFLADQPTPAEIIAYHPSESANERFYELIEAERDRLLSVEEVQELEGYISLEFIIGLVKVEAHRKLAQKVS